MTIRDKFIKLLKLVRRMNPDGCFLDNELDVNCCDEDSLELAIEEWSEYEADFRVDYLKACNKLYRQLKDMK